MFVVVEIRPCAGCATLGAGSVAKDRLRVGGIRVISYRESVAGTTIRINDYDLDRTIELLSASGFAARTTG